MNLNNQLWLTERERGITHRGSSSSVGAGQHWERSRARGFHKEEALPRKGVNTARGAAAEGKRKSLLPLPDNPLDWGSDVLNGCNSP